MTRPVDNPVDEQSRTQSRTLSRIEHPHQSRSSHATPVFWGHATSHASHAPRAVTHAPPFNRGACVLPGTETTHEETPR